MPLVSVEDLHLHYGARKIFEGDSLSIEAGERLGVVGPNGSGKSTLLKIIAGETQADAGRVSRSRGIRVRYLSQEHGRVPDLGLRDSVLSTAPGRDTLEERLQVTERALARASEIDEQMRLSESLAELHGALANLELEFGPHRAEAILLGLGFSDKDFDQTLDRFSGGWRMRAALAALLYQKPDVLLLDEPTNHLDLPSVNWLSSFLKSVKHAVVLTCHDREFLNRHVERVASLELEGLRTFRGNYDAYLRQREIDLLHLEARIEKEAERKKHMEAFVERFKAKATKARQAQSRVKMLERMESQQTELPELRRAMRVEFGAIPKCADGVLQVENLHFGYRPERRVLAGVHLEARRGDRVAIVGVNGAGKTTLLRLLAGELEPDGGSISFGRGATASYFAQHHSDALALGRSIVEEVRAAAPDASETRIRALCGAVLFTGDDVDKKVSVLSGGEKARVALARMLARTANVLLLDEPTNHLDTESADVLTESLQSFSGTLLFVSHNLDFARRLSTKVWDVSEGTVAVYPGTLGDYLDHVAARQSELEATFAQHGLEHARASPKAAIPAPTSTPSDKQARALARQEKKRAEAERRRLLRTTALQVEAAETEVARLESQKKALEAELAETSESMALRGLSERLGEVSVALERAMDAWTEAEARREALDTAEDPSP